MVFYYSSAVLSQGIVQGILMGHNIILPHGGSVYVISSTLQFAKGTTQVYFYNRNQTLVHMQCLLFCGGQTGWISTLHFRT